jgi:hypothetical protein
MSYFVLDGDSDKFHITAHLFYLQKTIETVDDSLFFIMYDLKSWAKFLGNPKSQLSS